MRTLAHLASGRPWDEPPPEPPAGAVLETRDSIDEYRIERTPDGWAIQYREGEDEHGRRLTGNPISWRAAWSAWGPPAGAEPFTPVPPGSPPLPARPPELGMGDDASGQRLDPLPAAKPHKPAKPTPARSTTASTTPSTGGTGMSSIEAVRARIAVANDRANEALGALTAALMATEEAQAALMHAAEGSGQAAASEATGLLGQAVESIDENRRMVSAAITAAESVAQRL